MFKDRSDAGKKLASALKKYEGQGVIVLAIPRGGVEIGCEIARGLNAGFSIVISRKMPLPGNPEAGFGALAEDGSVFFHESASRFVNPETATQVIKEQEKVIKKRVEKLRGGRPLPDIKGKTVILTDDGIAMGSTMRASIYTCREKSAGKIIAAAPVASPRVKDEIEALADDAVILESPRDFSAVAQAYENWYDATDDEVLALMKEFSGQYENKTKTQGGN